MGMKFEYEGATYDVPGQPKREWKWMLDNGNYCEAGNIICSFKCSGCIYSRGQGEGARKAFYYECFPEEKPAGRSHCEECANYKSKKEPKKLPKLTQEVFERKYCPEWAQWAAVDWDGKAYWYSKKPEPKVNQWYRCAQDPGKYQQIENSTGKEFDTSDWQDSLIERPIKKRPKLTQEVFNRPDCPDWAQYAVLDKRGMAYYTQYKPVACDKVALDWLVGGSYRKIPEEHFDASDWEHSLIERPVVVKRGRYVIIKEDSTPALECALAQWLADGWEPQGGVSFDSSTGWYMQAMIKKED